ncbi:MAG: crossover junction endodeoxyribonuclease RuvC [Verrucomicrobiota bacterium]
MGKKSARALWSAKLSGQAVAKPSSEEALESALASRQTPYVGTILGIDPSLRGTGLAVVRFQNNAVPKLLGSRTLKMPAKHSQAECLGAIAEAVQAILESESVNSVALEQTIYVQNFQTAQIMGMARGAAIAMASVAGLPIHEYAPLRIKQAVVGYGRASKDQVAAMVQQHLHLVGPLASDESDAAAVAICHAFTGSRNVG